MNFFPGVKARSLTDPPIARNAYDFGRRKGEEACRRAEHTEGGDDRALKQLEAGRKARTAPGSGGIEAQITLEKRSTRGMGWSEGQEANSERRERAVRKLVAAMSRTKMAASG